MPYSKSLNFFIVIFLLFLKAQSIVPPSKTFKYINQGPFGEYAVEYDVSYRTLNIVKFPFILCFYNATPNAFILGLRMGHRWSESIMRWVWDANRGKPVRENATLTFGTDGNLVLADVNGTIAWQTATRNKGVVGLEILPNGNLVLYDKKGKYIWQSFDHPTDTILVGQALRATGPNKIISRLSETDPSNGVYTYGMEKRALVTYYKSVNSQNPLPYYNSGDYGNGKGTLANLVFYCEPEYGQTYAYELGYTYDMKNSPSFGTSILTRPKYNSTYSMLRVDMDGNVRIYTYEEHVDWGPWEVTYKLFDEDIGVDKRQSCRLPKKCGSFGICENGQCVACPSPQGLLGWSASCVPPVLRPCKGGTNAKYYKVVGVEHFTSDYVDGQGMKMFECREKCSKDCGCLGYFYKEDLSKCLLVHELGTLVKVSNPAHVAYIKM